MAGKQKKRSTLRLNSFVIYKLAVSARQPQRALITGLRESRRDPNADDLRVEAKTGKRRERREGEWAVQDAHGSGERVAHGRKGFFASQAKPVLHHDMEGQTAQNT